MVLGTVKPATSPVYNSQHSETLEYWLIKIQAPLKAYENSSSVFTYIH